MPSVTAKRRCPELVFVKPRFDVYRAVSQQIRAIFADYTDLIEPLSLDEAYLDVTEDRRGLGSARAIAEEIRARIKAETGPHRLGRRQLLQVHRQAGVGPEQARRPVRHSAAQGRGVRRDLAGQALSRRRAGHRGEDGEARHSDRRRPGRLADRAAGGAFRIVGPLVLANRPRDRRAGSETGPALQVGQRGADIRRRLYRSRRFAPRAEPASRAMPGSGSSGRRSRAGRSRSRSNLAIFRRSPGRKASRQPVPDFAAFEAAGQALLEALLPVPKGIRLLGLGLHSMVEEDEVRAEAAGTRNLIIFLLYN